MSFYLCAECKQPAFFFRVRPKLGDHIDNGNTYYTKGDRTFDRGEGAYCQECDTKQFMLTEDRIVDNLDYLEKKYDEALARGDSNVR